MGKGTGPEAALEEPKMLGITAIKPVERHGFEALRWFLYDKNTGAIMGRTPKSWFLITAFYVVYYTFLSIFWLIMLYIFFLTIDEHSPKWQNANGIIGVSPGLGLRPSQSDKKIDSSIIIFNKDSEEDSDGGIPGYGGWVNRSQKFLQDYSEQPGNNCTLDLTVLPCNFELSVLGECAEKDYGYSSGRPCIFLKLNKIFGLVHKHYQSKKDFPEDAPTELKEHVEGQTNKDQVWIHCRGENPADVEALGPIHYYPKSRGIPGMYFPYMNQKNYLSPVVAVQFTGIPLGQLIHIECRAWAKNILYRRQDRLGIAHFELMLLNQTYTDIIEKNQSG